MTDEEYRDEKDFYAKQDMAGERARITTEALWCNHCGCEAVWARKDGLFYEGDADRCWTCHFPGDVTVDEDEIAHWRESEDADDSCTRADCKECRPSCTECGNALADGDVEHCADCCEDPNGDDRDDGPFTGSDEPDRGPL